MPLTPEETELYAAYRDKENAKARKRWDRIRSSEPPKQPKMTITSIMNRRREGLPLNAEETAMYAEYREKKTEYQREWRNENDGYYRDYKQKRKVEMAVAVGQ